MAHLACVDTEGRPAANAAQTSPIETLLSKATWDTREVLDWIIYRGREPEEIDTALTEGLHMNDDIMGSLWARAEGDPRSWAPDARPPAGAEHKPPRYSGKSQVFWGTREVGPDGKIARVFTAARCRARMRRWMRDMKMSARDLFAHGNALRERANAAIAAQNADENTALIDLNLAARQGLIEIWGRRTLSAEQPAKGPVRELIPKQQFDEIRVINVLGRLDIYHEPPNFLFLEPSEGFYWDLEYQSSQIQAVWPKRARARRGQTSTWALLSYAQNFYDGNGYPDTRDSMLTVAQNNGLKYRSALADYNALPVHLKRTQAQTDRALRAGKHRA